MTTFAGWLNDQDSRQDQVGALARLWKEVSPGRVHGLAGVTKVLQQVAELRTMTWVAEAIDVTTTEFRAWKVNPAASFAAPASKTQLDRIEAMLSALLDNLGIAVNPLTLVEESTEQAGAEVIAHPATALFGPDGELSQAPRPVEPPEYPVGTKLTVSGVEFTKHSELPGTIPHIGPNGLEKRPLGSVAEQAGLVVPWARMFEFADHDAPDEAAE